RTGGRSRPAPGCRGSPGLRCCPRPVAATPAESLRLLQNLDHPPPLGGRQRAGLHQRHPVTDAAGVVLVVRLQLARTPEHLAVERVLDLVFDPDYYGLVHLVADHDALPHLASAARLGLGSSALGHGLLLAHDVAAADSDPASDSPAPDSASRRAAANSDGAAERPSSRSRMMV